MRYLRSDGVSRAMVLSAPLSPRWGMRGEGSLWSESTPEQDSVGYPPRPALGLPKLCFEFSPTGVELIDASTGLSQCLVRGDELHSVRGDGRIFSSQLLTFQCGFGFKNLLFHAFPFQPVQIR